MPNGVLAGSRVDGTDWLLPVVVTGHGNGGNVITAAAFTVLPTTTCTAAITNPHPTAPLLVLCTFGAWLTSVAGSDVRCCPNVTGSVSISAGIGCGGPIGWGEIPIRTEANKGHHEAWRPTPCHHRRRRPPSRCGRYAPARARSTVTSP